MGVDPRYISEWLRTQWTADAARMIAGRRETGSAQQESAGIDFASVLQLFETGNSLLQQEADGAAAVAGIVGVRPTMLPEAVIPAADDREIGSDLEQLSQIVSTASSKYGVDASLVKAVIQAESGFRTDAVSAAGAKGLMQLMDSTASMLGVSDAFDPQQNIHGGTRYLSFLLHKYNGNTAVALAAYNAGPGRIDRLGFRTDGELLRQRALLPEETQRYVEKVLTFQEQIQSNS